jgi:hypothetical protein
MYYVKLIFRQRLPQGYDAPRAQCEATKNGPFSTREGAEGFARAVASTTAVLEASIVEES